MKMTIFFAFTHGLKVQGNTCLFRTVQAQKKKKAGGISCAVNHQQGCFWYAVKCSGFLSFTVKV